MPPSHGNRNKQKTLRQRKTKNGDDSTRDRRGIASRNAAAEAASREEDELLNILSKQNRLETSWRKWCIFFGIIVAVSAVFMLWSGFDPGFDDEDHPSTGEGSPAKNTESGKRIDEELRESQVERVYEHFTVLDTIPHDPEAFTQGLTWYNGRLFEGTGMNGKSELREVDVQRGDTLRRVELDAKYFGEGISHFTLDDNTERIIQLTWRDKTGWIYDAKSFEILKEFEYETTTGEGWGITYDRRNKEFIVSDGSSFLHFWDRDTLQEKRRLQVTAPQIGSNPNPQPVRYLNELEFYRGSVLSNIWYSNQLIRIDPVDGSVTFVYDFSELFVDRPKSADCFNGIAVSDEDDVVYVTGKRWPNLYRVRLIV